MKINSKYFVFGFCAVLMGFSSVQAKKKYANDDAGRNYGGDAPKVVKNLLYPPSYEKCMKKNIPVITRKKIYKNGWIDLNKNGKKDVYEDPKASINARVEDLLKQMTMQEKTAQMVTLYGYSRVCKDFLPTKKWKKEVWGNGLGAIDEHLNGFNYFKKNLPGTRYLWPASKHAWALNEVQRYFIEDTRLGIPVDFTNEGIRGIENVRASNFPTQLAMGSTWDRDLLLKEGEVTGKEAFALGYSNCYAPIMDILRDPRWGRCEESFGESPYLASELGIQMVRGIQANRVAATMKHYAIYGNNKGAREGNSRCDPQCGERESEYIHLWAFERVIKQANALGVMASYNDYDRIPIAGSRYYLTDILRKRMGFKGYVVSDSNAVSYLQNKHHTAANFTEAVYQAVKAGLDVRCNFVHPSRYLGPLRSLVKKGRLTQEDIDERVRCILRVKFWQGNFDDPYRNLKKADQVVMSKENLAVARRASYEGLVLLKNKGILPFSKKVRSILVCGPNADEHKFALGHYGPLDVHVVTVLEGLKAACKKRGITVKYAKGCERLSKNEVDNELMWQPPSKKEQKQIDEAVSLAKSCDVVVCVVGDLPNAFAHGPSTSGENRSRTGLNLTGRQDDLIRAMCDTGKPTVVVHLAGRPNSINWAKKKANAILHTFFPGMFGGEAIAAALLGNYNPGGHLPATFPKSAGQLELNFPATPNSQTGFNNISANGPLYPFGYGLSYTTFEFSDLNVDWAGKKSGKKPTVKTPFTVSCKITNTGSMKGDTVAQLYLRDSVSTTIAYDLVLRGFERVSLKPGQSKMVTFKVDPQDALWLLDKQMKRVVEPGRFNIYVGDSSVSQGDKKKVTEKPGIKLIGRIDLVQD